MNSPLKPQPPTQPPIPDEAKGERICGYDDLRAMAKSKRSVLFTHSWLSRRPWPAAFVMNMNYSFVCRAIEAGMHVYLTPNKRPKPTP